MRIDDFSLLALQWGHPPASHRDLIAVAKHAEQLGFHSFGLPHVPLWPPAEQYPDSDNFLGMGRRFPYHLDSHALVPVLLHETSRMKVGFNILITPLIHPFHWAKYIASLDVMSGGRVVAGFGLGVARPVGEKGAKVPSMYKVGVETRYRGRTADESLEIMTQLWSSDDALTYEGRFWTAIDVAIRPQSLQKPYPELWWAGTSQQSIDRAARYANFLEITWPPEASIRNFLAPGLREANERFGRNTKLADLIMVEILNYDPTPEQIKARYKSFATEDAQVIGTPARCAEHLMRLADAGVEHFVIDFHGHGIDPIERFHEQMELLCGEVLPLLR